MFIEREKPELILEQDCIITPKMICSNHQIEYGLLNSFVITGIGYSNRFNFSINSGYFPIIEIESIEEITEYVNKRKNVSNLFEKEFDTFFPEWDGDRLDNYDNKQYIDNTYQSLSNFFLKCLKESEIINTIDKVSYQKTNLNSVLNEFSMIIANHEHHVNSNNLKKDLRKLIELKPHYKSYSEKTYLLTRNITNAFIDINLFITTKEMDFLFLLQYINNQ